jgi:multimeric flavodoxin WrbA
MGPVDIPVWNNGIWLLVNRVFQELQKEGIETELVQLSGEKIRGCIACYKYFENKDQRCSVTNDILNSCVEKIHA